MTRDSRRFLPPEAITRISRLDLRAREIVEGYLTGLHRSPYFGQSIEFVQIRLEDHLALCIGALVDFITLFARDQGVGFAVVHLKRQGSIATSDLEHIAKPRRGDDTGARPFAFEHRVGGERGAMDDQADVTGRHLGRGGDRAHAGQRAEQAGQALAGAAKSA